MPKTNEAFWAKKFHSNVERDRETERLLREDGWSYLRFWAHEDADDIIEVISESVQLKGATLKHR